MYECDYEYDDCEATEDCPLDGDIETGLASAGWGTDEDYGDFGCFDSFGDCD